MFHFYLLIIHYLSVKALRPLTKFLSFHFRLMSQQPVYKHKSGSLKRRALEFCKLSEAARKCTKLTSFMNYSASNSTASVFIQVTNRDSMNRSEEDSQNEDVPISNDEKELQPEQPKRKSPIVTVVGCFPTSQRNGKTGNIFTRG